MKINYHATVPAHVWQGWQKAFGPQPGNHELMVAHAFSQRFGLEAFAGLACALRKQGVTVAQQRAISTLWSNGTSTGAHQNKVRTLVAGGFFNDARTSKGQPLALTLTDKGNQVVERFTGSTTHDRVLSKQVIAKAKATPAKAAKATPAKAAKAKAPKAKPVKAPITEPVATPAPAMLDGTGASA